MISIDPASSLPPYEQIRAQVAAAITRGTMAAGTRLPTVRALAEDLGLAVNTVARAYRELETAGLVQTRGRAGTTVTASGDAAREQIRSAAAEYAATVRRVGLADVEAVALVRAALQARPAGAP